MIDITVLDFSIEINRATGAYDEDGALTVHAAVNATRSTGRRCSTSIATRSSARTRPTA